MMGAGNASGRFLGPLIILSAMTASIPIASAPCWGRWCSTSGRSRSPVARSSAQCCWAGCSRSPFNTRGRSRRPPYQEILMFDLLLRRARLADDTLTDIAIQDGKIARRWATLTPPRIKRLSLTATCSSAQAGLTLTFTATRTPRFTTTSRTAWALPPASPPWWTRAVPVPTTWTISTKSPESLHRGVCPAEHLPRGLIAQNELANMANIDADAVKQAVKRHLILSSA